MSKKKQHHEEHVDETWLIPYADVLTLLLALFIVLFATSQVDKNKVAAMAQTFNSIITGGTGVLEYTSATPMSEVPGPTLPPVDGESQEDKEAKEKEMKDLEGLKSQLDDFIKQQDLSLSLQTQLTERGLLITIADRALFESGSSEVKKDAIGLAHDISKLLVTNPIREIMISGHTDNMPIHTPQFRDNWDLSSARAINFMKILLENKQHNPKYFTASGQGEYRPITGNDTAKGRERNRRVEVLILPNYKVN